MTRLSPLAAAAGLALLVGACASAQPVGPLTAISASRADENRFEVTEIAERLSVAIARDGSGLSDVDRDAVARFAADWDARGRGNVVVEAPPAGGDGALVAAQIRRTLAQAGVPERFVEQRPARSATAVELTFLRYEARLAECPSYGAIDMSNVGTGASPRFGCAINQNILAMVEDPGDLAGPRAMDPASSARRSVVMGRYILGQPTMQQLNDDMRATLSQVAGQ
jgi:pilus assembly protein CpaD